MIDGRYRWLDCLLVSIMNHESATKHEASGVKRAEMAQVHEVGSL